MSNRLTARPISTLPRGRSHASGWLPLLGAAMIACAEAEPHPQLLVVVDTDAPLVGQLDTDGTLSPDAAVDTLWVDVYGRAVDGGDVRTVFAAPEVASWPISFGIAALPGGGVQRLRLRAFRSALALPREVPGEDASPREEATIDRILEIEQPSDGVVTARALLSFACLGRRSSLIAERTCVDADRIEARFDEGVARAADATTEAASAGTSPLARSVPCSGPEPAGAVCVPGGFSYLGSEDAFGGETWASGGVDPLPLRPVYVRPFFIDRLEFTVKRLRALMAAGADIEEPVAAGCSSGGYATWSGAAASDAKPVNCISWDAARSACQIEGGDLPTEIQWEHAARARRGWRYPWGNSFPECCAASLSRSAETGAECGGPGAEDAGSHVDPGQCSSQRDITPDGVVDMAGSVSELMLDDLAPYDEGCWARPGIFPDGFVFAAQGAHAVRGGSWGDGLANALAALRRVHWRNALQGFRCAYTDGSP